MVLCCGAAAAGPRAGFEGGGESAGGATVILRGGTPVQLAFAESVSSKTATQGGTVRFVLASDVRIGGTTVAKAGSNVSGRLTFVKHAAAPGRSGALNIQLDYLEAGNAKVKLRGSKDKQGVSEIQYSRPYHLKWPMGLMRTGDDIEISQGTTLTVFVAEDIALPAAE
jgi:hypothetical protein